LLWFLLPIFRGRVFSRRIFTGYFVRRSFEVHGALARKEQDEDKTVTIARDAQLTPDSNDFRKINPRRNYDFAQMLEMMKPGEVDVAYAFPISPPVVIQDCTRISSVYNPSSRACT